MNACIDFAHVIDTRTEGRDTAAMSETIRAAPTATDDTMEDIEMLARIPGELIEIAAQSLPEAASSDDTFRDASVQLPDGRNVLITFRRLNHQRGRTRHWFWSAIRAVPVDAGDDRVAPTR